MATVHYHRNPSHSPIVSALTVCTDCVCYGAQCCGYNGKALVQKTSHIISRQFFEAVNAIQTLKISARTTTFMWHSQCECVAVKRSVVVRILRSMVLWDTVGTVDTRVVVRRQQLSTQLSSSSGLSVCHGSAPSD